MQLLDMRYIVNIAQIYADFCLFTVDPAYKGLMEHLPAAPANQPVLDEMQDMALRQALTNSFTVINGVAGSGKTTLAARLVYYYALVRHRARISVIKSFENEHTHTLISYSYTLYFTSKLTFKLQVNNKVYNVNKSMNEFAVKQVAMVCAPTLAGLDIVERKCDVKIVRTVHSFG